MLPGLNNVPAESPTLKEKRSIWRRFASLKRLASTASAADGAGLSGFSGTLNYAVRTIGWAANGFEVDPRWFASSNGYVFGNGVVDDYAAIQAAINWIPSTGAGVVRFPRNCTARTSAQIVASNRKVIIDLQMSSLTLTANATSLFDLVGDTITLRNGYLLKSPGVTAQMVTGRDGSVHRYENLISWDQNWTKVFHITNIRDSEFRHNSIKNNSAAPAGNIWEIDYCVNNVWVGGSYMFSDQAFYCTSVAHPTFGYFCEGVNLLGVATYGNKKSVTADRVTNLSIGSGCMFDFNLTWGVFATNGNNMAVANGVWIAGDTANGFVGVGTGASFEGAAIGACTISRGASAITGTVGVSLPGPRASVIGTRFASGMNGGAVTAATSVVIAPQYEGGGTAITTPSGNAGPAEIAGAWTPAINFGGAAVGVTYNTLAGTYTKVGNEYTARCRITLSSKGSSTGTFQITGLPGTNNGAYYGSALVVRQQNMVTAVSTVGQVQLSSNSAVFFSNSAPATTIDNTYFNNNSTIDCEFRYQV